MKAAKRRVFSFRGSVAKTCGRSHTLGSCLRTRQQIMKTTKNNTPRLSSPITLIDGIGPKTTEAFSRPGVRTLKPLDALTLGEVVCELDSKS